LLAHAVSQWASVEGKAAAEWAQRDPDPLLRHRLLGAIAVGFAKQDPGAAAALVAAGLPAGREQDCAAVAIVQRWAQQAPEDAARWVAQFADTPSRTAAAENLAALWAARDESQARALLRLCQQAKLDSSFLVLRTNQGCAAVADACSREFGVQSCTMNCS